MCACCFLYWGYSFVWHQSCLFVVLSIDVFYTYSVWFWFAGVLLLGVVFCCCLGGGHFLLLLFLCFVCFLFFFSFGGMVGFLPIQMSFNFIINVVFSTGNNTLSLVMITYSIKYIMSACVLNENYTRSCSLKLKQKEEQSCNVYHVGWCLSWLSSVISLCPMQLSLSLVSPFCTLKKWNRTSVKTICKLRHEMSQQSHRCVYNMLECMGAHICCCCCVPQLNTLRVTRYVHSHLYTSAATQHRVRGLRVWPFSITPPCRQPHSVFRGWCAHIIHVAMCESMPISSALVDGLKLKSKLTLSLTCVHELTVLSKSDWLSWI